MKRMMMLFGMMLASCAAMADTEVVDGIEWTYTVSDGKASVGDGTYTAVSSSTTGEITIPAALGGYPVTSIGRYAFAGCSGLTSIGIPSSVTNIGERAFSGCSGLTSVTIPEGVTSIGYYTFEDCDGLTSVTIPSSVTSIGDYAFYGCRGLTSVTIPEGVTSVGYRAFEYCSGLTRVTIPSSVTSIGQQAFAGCCELMSFDVDAGNPYYKSENGLLLTKDGRTLVAGVNYDVAIPSSVTTIGVFAFQECTGLAGVTIPTSVTSIDDYAFYGCSGLTSVTIPSSVTSIGRYAFYGCSGLGDGVVVVDNCVLTVNGTCPTTVVLPEGTRLIARSAFEYCRGLARVTIPSSVTSIGQQAFEGCNGLKDVTVPGWKCGMSFLSVTNLVISEGTTNIIGHAFDNCSGLTSVTIPSSVTSIGEAAFFGCYKLASVTIPSSITGIGDYAFANCCELPSITIPEGVTTIGSGAFAACSGLTSATIPSSVTNIGKRAFSNCSGLMSFDVAEKNLKYKSENGLLLTKDGRTLVAGVNNWWGVTIPEGVTSIGNYAFEGCDVLTSVTIPEGVTSIGGGAFCSCYDLTSVTIPSSVTSIGDYAFEGCYNLTSVTIPESVTNIGEGVFCGCGMTSVTIPESVTNIGDYAFGSCNNLTSVTMPEGVTSIGERAFEYCSGLTSVMIPEGVTSIGDDAFHGCTSLNTVDFEGAPPEGVANANIKTDAAIRYNVAYEEEWLPVIAECGFTNATAYEPSESPEGAEATVKRGRWCNDFVAAKAYAETNQVPMLVIWGNDGCAYCDKLEAACAEEDFKEWANERQYVMVAVRGKDTASGLAAYKWIKSVDATIFSYPFVGVYWTNDCSVCETNLVQEAFVGRNGKMPVTEGTLQEQLMASVDMLLGRDQPEPQPWQMEITFVVPNGEASEYEHTYTNGAYGSLPEARREGFTFAGWYTSLDGAERVSAFSSVLPGINVLYARWVEDDASLYAQWEANKYSVSFNANGGEGEMAAQPFLYNQTQALNKNAFTKLGYTFKGWSTAPDGEVVYINGVSVSNLTAEAGFAVALFAKWEKAIDVATEVVEEWVGYTLAPKFKKQGETNSQYRKRFEAEYGDDYAVAFFTETGKIGMDGTKLQVWHDYVAGTDPLDKNSQFTATITFDDKGVPKVDYNPKFSDAEEAAKRIYTTYGKKNLADKDWSVVDGHEADYNFFKVTVEMK